MGFRLDNERNAYMNRIEKEIYAAISSIEIKKTYMADRNETIDTMRAAESYISAMYGNDNFYSHHSYSAYALHKAGLFDDMYSRDKTKIPLEKRDEVLQYEREYILASYSEPNNYYRMLAGMPDVGDYDYIYTKKRFEGVDSLKPVHKMTKTERTILSVRGELDELLAMYPDKKYLGYLDPSNVIPIDISRSANDFSIISIRRNTNITDTATERFISIYNQAKNYVIDKFRNEVFADTSEYYDAFIGIFIIFIAMQRYIIKYSENIIRRDFFDKEIIKWFFESYSIPWYSEIPISYLQRVAKNMNMLIYKKGTDQVFFDIFKLFDLHDIDIKNLVLVKDIMTDINGNPVVAYTLNHNHGGYVDTITDIYQHSSRQFPLSGEEFAGFMGANNTELLPHLENVKTIRRCSHNSPLAIKDFLLVHMNSGELRLYNYAFNISNIDRWEFPTSWWTKFIPPNGDEPYYVFKDINVKWVYPIKFNNFSYHGVMILTETYDLYYKNDSANENLLPWSISDLQADMFNLGYSYERYGLITSFDIKSDSVIYKNDSTVVHINFDKGSIVGYKGEYGVETTSGEFEKVFDTVSDKTITEGSHVSYCDMSNQGIVMVLNTGLCYCFGDNYNRRFSVPNPVFYKAALLPTIISNISRVKVCEEGAFFIMSDGGSGYTGQIPELDLPMMSLDSDYIKFLDYVGVMDLNFYRTDYNDAFFILDFHKERSDVFYRGGYARMADAFIENESRRAITSLHDIPQAKYCYKLLHVNAFNILFYHDACIVSKFEPEVTLSFMGKAKSQFPFITSNSFISKVQIEDIADIVEFNNTLYGITLSRDIVYWNTKSNDWAMSNINYLASNNNFQKLFLFKTTFGENFLIITNGTSNPWFMKNEDEFVNNMHADLELPIMDIYPRSHKDNTLNYVDLSGDIFVFDVYGDYGDNIARVNNISASTSGENEDGARFELIANLNNNTGNVDCEYIVWNIATGNPTRWIFNITNMTFDTIFRIGKDKNTVTIQGHDIYVIDLNQIIVGGLTYVKAYIPVGLGGTLYRGELNNSEVCFYNTSGGLTVPKHFSHADKLDFIIEGDFVELYNDDAPNGVVALHYTKDYMFKITNHYKFLTYEEDVERMFDLSFCAVDIDSSSISTDLEDTRNYTSYDSITGNDPLWGPRGDKTEFTKSILRSEFNYTYSKYINVQTKFDLTRLNFEVCYMFKQLHDHKDNISTIIVESHDFGKATLFDVVVGIFAALSYKLGFDGNIMGTNTKAASVLGFNFDQDWGKLMGLISKTCLSHNDDFDPEEIRIIQAPKLYSNGADLVDNFLDNGKVMSYIIDAKYKTKNIGDYNVLKKIEQASLHAKLSRDMYMIDGTMPKTYMDYLEHNSYGLYTYLLDTNDESVLSKMDSLLNTITSVVDSQHFEYIFLKIPSLSVDSLMKFIYYLVNIFKSYTVELNSMDIIYHLDDKKIHNIKMILDEDGFGKIWGDWDKVNLSYFIKTQFESFEDFEKLAMVITNKPVSELNDYDIINLFKSNSLASIISDQYYNGSLSTDFNDIIEKYSAEYSVDFNDVAVLEMILSQALFSTKITHLISRDEYSFAYSNGRSGEMPLEWIVKGAKYNFNDMLSKISNDMLFRSRLSISMKSEPMIRFMVSPTKVDMSDDRSIISNIDTKNDLYVSDSNLTFLQLEQLDNIRLIETVKFERNE